MKKIKKVKFAVIINGEIFEVIKIEFIKDKIIAFYSPDNHIIKHTEDPELYGDVYYGD